ncbi:Phosphatidylinositol N-acetylglucosaminyltransferase GPI3 subunit [Tilletia horrida]|nr:Phosphatidylinositol N-acetylglucosaminyltransferase GPI3 subunit [Tilletia horrida]
MISDFFYPNVGGVEGHIYTVSQKLIQRGHKVIVVTHAYPPNRTGVRWMPPGIKVYYVPYAVLARQDTLPNFFSLLPLLRQIFIRERIELVHSHQALSSMGHEGILHARSMGIRAVFTDHSLFGFADAASILTNKLLKFALSDVDHVVCVSHTGKENTVLRAAVEPAKVSVIPNAVVSADFRPNRVTSHLPTERITIVVLSRLMYRKGIDLLIAAIPRLCAEHEDIHFLIGGDGPKRVDLEQMREKYLLHDRVELVGAVRPSDACAHLNRGQLFLNTSLTEAFGTSIIEAASAGLFVVSTRVGGVPEVLPADLVELAEPDEDVASMYSWTDVAARLEQVYMLAMEEDRPSPWERLCAYRACGPIAGLVFVILIVVGMLFLEVLERLWPRESIDEKKDLTVCDTITNHPHSPPLLVDAMGFRAGFVLSSAFFLYGVLFLCSIVDFPLVYYEWKPSAADEAEVFYLSFFRAPSAVHALMHGMVFLGLIGLLAKLHRWSEVAKYYDGGSLALFVAAICMYLGVCLPNVRLLSDPSNVKLIAKSSILTQRRMEADSIARAAGLDPPESIDETSPLSPDERIQSLRVIAASNTIIMILLAGVVLLQAAEWYIAHVDAQAAETERRKQMRELAASGSTPGPSASSSLSSGLATSTGVSANSTAEQLKKRS